MAVLLLTWLMETFGLVTTTELPVQATITDAMASKPANAAIRRVSLRSDLMPRHPLASTHPVRATRHTLYTLRHLRRNCCRVWRRQRTAQPCTDGLRCAGSRHGFNR